MSLDRWATRVAVAGCGQWGRNLVRSYAQLGALAAVCDPDPAAAAREAAAHVVAARSFEDVLIDPTIGAVAIAAPAEHHAAMATAALAAGKDVYVEKPLALDMTGAAAIARAAAAAPDRIVMVGHLLRYHPAFEALLALVQSGRLGGLRYIHAERISLGRLRTEENVFASFAPHDLSMILALMGDAPTAIAARGEAFITPGIADVARCDLTFPGGRTAAISTSWLSPMKSHRLIVVGEAAGAVFDDTRGWPEKLMLRDYAVVGDEAPRLQGGDPTPAAVTPGEPLLAECAHFLACCDTREQPRTGLEEALRVQEILEVAARQLGETPCS